MMLKKEPEKKYQTGLVIMRAQPFHIGHEQLLRKMLAECEQAIVLLGSIQEVSRRNPFSYRERLTMITRVFPAEVEKGRIMLGGVADIHNPPKWVDYVMERISRIPANFETKAVPEVLYCGDFADGELFAAKGMPFEIIDRSILNVSGTKVRELINARDNEWQRLVPAMNVEFIKRCLAAKELAATTLAKNYENFTRI